MTEFERRTDRLRAAMQDAGVDLIAIGPTANMRYLAGFVPQPDERLCLLLLSSQTTQAIVPQLNAAEWSAENRLLFFPLPLGGEG